jgi:hypothetical protein
MFGQSTIIRNLVKLHTQHVSEVNDQLNKALISQFVTHIKAVELAIKYFAVPNATLSNEKTLMQMDWSIILYASATF